MIDPPAVSPVVVEVIDFSASAVNVAAAGASVGAEVGLATRTSYMVVVPESSLATINMGLLLGLAAAGTKTMPSGDTSYEPGVVLFAGDSANPSRAAFL